MTMVAMNPSRWRLTRIAIAVSAVFVWNALRREFDYQIVLQLGLLLFFYVVVFCLLGAAKTNSSAKRPGRHFGPR
jgi:uncharacterized membrane protein YcgQ (UPF0703/DUF1980 family)